MNMIKFSKKLLLVTLLPLILVNHSANADSFTDITSITSEFVVKRSAVPVTLTVTPVSTLVDNATESANLVVANVTVSTPQAKRLALRLPNIAGIQEPTKATAAWIKGSNTGTKVFIEIQNPNLVPTTIGTDSFGVFKDAKETQTAVIKKISSPAIPADVYKMHLDAAIYNP